MVYFLSFQNKSFSFGCKCTGKCLSNAWKCPTNLWKMFHQCNSYVEIETSAVMQMFIMQLCTSRNTNITVNVILRDAWCVNNQCMSGTRSMLLVMVKSHVGSKEVKW